MTASPTIWTRAHLLTHFARNADSLGNLLAWAETGVEQPMYGSGMARDDDIEAGLDFASALVAGSPRALLAWLTGRGDGLALTRPVPEFRSLL